VPRTRPPVIPSDAVTGGTAPRRSKAQDWGAVPGLDWQETRIEDWGRGALVSEPMTVPLEDQPRWIRPRIAAPWNSVAAPPRETRESGLKIPHDIEWMKSSSTAFRTNAWNLLGVSIGEKLQGMRSFGPEFPYHLLDKAAEHTLKVVVRAKGMSIEPLGEVRGPEEIDTIIVGKLRELNDNRPRSEAVDDPGVGGIAKAGTISLRRYGDSTEFLLAVRPYTSGPVEISIYVFPLENPKLTQLARLKARAVDSLAELKKSQLASVAIDAALRALDADVDKDGCFDAAIIVDRSDRGTNLIAMSATRVAILPSLPDMTEQIRKIESKLGSLTDEKDPEKPLRDEWTRKLLVFLAHPGKLLWDAIAGDFLLKDGLASADRLQVVSNTRARYIPFEFLYEGSAPQRKAALCPNAEAALQARSCGHCPQRNSGDYVCPLRFWGLAKVIERRTFNPSDKIEGEHRIESEFGPRRSFGKFTAAIFAASSKAEDFPDGRAALQRVEESLSSLIASSASAKVRVQSWRDWSQKLKGKPPPNLLILLPHVELDPDLQEQCLEIGGSDRLSCAEIDSEYVGIDAPKLVLLLGCSTANPKERLEPFTARFQRAGASIVLATVSKIMGRHAAPMAATLVEFLRRQDGNAGMSFGDFVRDLRCDLLRRGFPSVLALAAFGDADWDMTS
jgi:hypothetical protein